MNVVRNELRTGILVVTTLAIVAAVLVYYGAAGGFRERKRFQVFFDDAGGIQPGATVTLSGRKIGQVRRLISPVPEAQRPKPNLQVIIEVEVGKSALIYREQKVIMLQYGFLGDQLIDFTNGVEASGLAPPDMKFIGERQLTFNEAAPKIIEMLDPLLKRSTELVEELQKTAQRLTAITGEGSDFNLAIENYKKLSDHLNELTGPEGSFKRSLDNLETLTGPEGGVSRTLKNLEELTGKESDLSEGIRSFRDFTDSLSSNKDIALTLRNFRQASAKLNTTMTGVNKAVKKITPCLNATAHNAAQFTDTIKRQPWRLIWPSTKKYPEDKAKNYVLVREETEIIIEKPKRQVWVVEPTPCPTPPKKPKDP